MEHKHIFFFLEFDERHKFSESERFKQDNSRKVNCTPV